MPRLTMMRQIPTKNLPVKGGKDECERLDPDARRDRTILGVMFSRVDEYLMCSSAK